MVPIRVEMGSLVPIYPSVPPDQEMRAIAPSLGRRAGASAGGWGPQSLGIHLVLLAVVVGAMAVVLGSGSIFNPDEGSYHLQLRALRGGSWVLHTDAERFDPDGSFYPVVYADRTVDGFVPLAKHPLWPFLGLLASRLVGPGAAFAVLGGLGVMVTATAGWFVARLREEAWAPFAFWVAALAPVTVTATIGWAHAAAAAAGGVALLGARVLLRGTTWAGPALLVAGCASSVMLRTEGLLFNLALAAALVLIGAFDSKGRIRAWSVAGAVLAISISAFAVESLWIRSIIGADSPNLEPRRQAGGEAIGFVAGRVQATRIAVLEPSGGAIGALGLVSVAVAAYLAFRWVRSSARPVEGWAVAALAAMAWSLVRVGMGDDEAITGLLPAWPLAVVGLAAVGWDVGRRFSVEVLCSGFFAAGVLATSYPDGGSIQWGGRFLTPLTVPLGVVAAAGVHRLWRAGRSLMTPVAIVALALVPLAHGVFVVATTKAHSRKVFDVIATERAGLSLTTSRELPRMMWDYPDVPWLLVEVDDGRQARLPTVLAALHDDGPEVVSLVVPAVERGQAEDALRRARWQVVSTADASPWVVLVARP